jgi:hypothetical protein
MTTLTFAGATFRRGRTNLQPNLRLGTDRTTWFMDGRSTPVEPWVEAMLDKITELEKKLFDLTYEDQMGR